MDPRKLFIDDRFRGVCSYCGGPPDTRDHTPSKILLDEPLPGNLGTVEACSECNRGFSLDEEYFACFLECVISGSTDLAQVSRDKVREALRHNSRLASLIQETCRTRPDGSLLWMPDETRVRNVIVKLARGHSAFELSLQEIEDPDDVTIAPLARLSEADVLTFDPTHDSGSVVWPELGSRAFLRAVGCRPYDDEPGTWVIVQENRYRYAVDQDNGTRVRIVLSEYLACLVAWY